MRKKYRIITIAIAVLMVFTIVPVMNSVPAFAATGSSSSSITVNPDKYRQWASQLDGYADYFQQFYEQQQQVRENAENSGAWTDSHIYELQNLNSAKEDIRKQVGAVASDLSGYSSGMSGVADSILDLNRKSRSGSISDMSYINRLHDIAASLRNSAAEIEWLQQQVDQQLGSLFAGDSLTGTYSDDDDSLKISGNGSGSGGEEQSSGSIERRKIKEDMYNRYEEHLKSKKKLQLPDWLSFIGDRAFSGWTSLNSYLFYSETKSENIKMRTSSLDDSSLLGIGEQAFADCTGLEEIVIPSSVTAVGEEAFAGCSSVGTIIIEDGAEGFGDNVFSGCENLESLEIPGSVGTVSAGFITDCPNLNRIDLGEGITRIEEGAFANNPGLTDVYLPESIEEIDDTFLDGDGMVTIHGFKGTAAEDIAKETGNEFDSLGAAEIVPDSGSCGENLTWSLSDDGILTISGEGAITESPWLYTHSKEIQSVILEEGVTEICDMAFRGCRNLENVSLPNSLTSIGSQAFMYGNYVFGEDGAEGKLKSVTIPANVTTIGDYAFGVYWAIDPDTGDELELTVEDFVVSGSEGSAAQDYANKYGLTFTVSEAETPAQYTFTDVTDPTTFYYEPVYWAVDEGITTGWAESDGTYTFRPWNDCNRAAVVTFLWRMAGEPEPSAIAKFKDMPADEPKNSDFRKAISWAVEQGITTGWEDNTFRPWNNCNRAAIMTFIWRYAGEPSAAASIFKDPTSNKDFNKAIAWASENEISTGWTEKDGSKTFRPWNTCNRASVAAFLYRYSKLRDDYPENYVPYDIGATDEQTYIFDGSVTGTNKVNGGSYNLKSVLTMDTPVKVILQGEIQFTERYRVGSNTEIIADGATIYSGSNGDGCLTNEVDSYDYDAFENVIIRGGTWKKKNGYHERTMMFFVHGSNIRVEDASIECSINGGHCIELVACKDVVVDNCDLEMKGDYTGTRINEDEPMQLDHASTATAPTIPQKAVNYHACKNIQIKNSTMIGGRGLCAGHGGTDANCQNVYHENVILEDNYIEGLSSEGCALFNVYNATITGNTIKADNSDVGIVNSCALHVQIPEKSKAPAGMENTTIRISKNECYGGRNGILVYSHSDYRSTFGYVYILDNQVKYRGTEKNAILTGGWDHINGKSFEGVLKNKLFIDGNTLKKE